MTWQPIHVMQVLNAETKTFNICVKGTVSLDNQP